MNPTDITQAQKDFIRNYIQDLVSSVWDNYYASKYRDPNLQVIMTSEPRRHRQFMELDIKIQVYRLQPP